ncbi:hypothetical protein [Asticcacaulis solisilvae]|uniref:hypothetical protein n=1 Tax=Asticcacaulis solisilvae TaxID=1217274 RepID=UPI003FD79FD7
MSESVWQILHSLLFLGVSLVFLFMAVHAWVTGRILVRGQGWLTRREDPFAFHFYTILFTLIGGAFSLGGIVYVAVTLRRVFGF